MHPSLRTALLCLLSLLAACAEAHPTEPPAACGTATPATADTSTDEALAESLAVAVCARTLRCSSVFELPMVGVIDSTESCHPSALRRVSEMFVNRPRALRCLERLRAANCAADNGECEGALSATPLALADGAPCFWSFECASERCSGLTASCGVCEPAAGLGAVCSADSDCAVGLCVARVCAAPGTGRPGDACSTGAACAPELVCEGYQCVPVLAEGADCTAFAHCGSDQVFCSDGVCRVWPSPRAAVGDACGGSSRCGPGLNCALSTGRCVARIGFGCGCSDDEECPALGTCVAGQCAPLPDPGEACGAPWGACLHGVCVDGRCALLAAGAVCLQNIECASGTCDYATADVPRCAAYPLRGEACAAGETCADGLACAATGTCEPMPFCS